MRVVFALVVVVLLSSTGCCPSFLLATSGKDLGTLPTREQVREEFGTPVASGVEDGKHFEDFHTRRKIADRRGYFGYPMGYAMTLGLIEFYALPRQLFITSKRSVLGQDLRFIYDETGKVVQVQFDGEPLPLRVRQEYP
jgi:hypothetical protein